MKITNKKEKISLNKSEKKLNLMLIGIPTILTLSIFLINQEIWEIPNVLVFHYIAALISASLASLSIYKVNKDLKEFKSFSKN